MSTFPPAPTPVSPANIAHLSDDELVTLGKTIINTAEAGERVYHEHRDACAVAVAVFTQALVERASPFAVGARLRLVADGTEWHVERAVDTDRGWDRFPRVLRHVKLVMRRFNADGRLGEVVRDYTFAVGNAADTNRFENVEAVAAAGDRA